LAAPEEPDDEPDEELDDEAGAEDEPLEDEPFEDEPFEDEPFEEDEDDEALVVVVEDVDEVEAVAVEGDSLVFAEARESLR
jgi:hypothetical protein